MRVKVPPYVKKAVRMALREREIYADKPGLSLKEAKKEGVRSGVQTARILLRSQTIGEERAKAIGRFYDRFKNIRTPRSEVAIKLWGGRRFGRSMAKRF